MEKICIRCYKLHRRALDQIYGNHSGISHFYSKSYNISGNTKVSSHPDKDKQNRTPEGQRRYSDLTFALEVLTDEEKRKDYEDLLKNGLMRQFIEITV